MKILQQGFELEGIERGFQKALLGWDIPAFYYDSDNQLVATNQDHTTGYSGTLLRKLKEQYGDRQEPFFYWDEDSFIYMMFAAEQGIVILGPVTAFGMSGKRTEQYLASRGLVGRGFVVKQIPLDHLAACLSTVCYFVTGRYYDERDMMEPYRVKFLAAEEETAKMVISDDEGGAGAI